MTPRLRLLALFFAAFPFVLAACDEGTEGAACVDDTECQEGLVCADDGTCQALPDGTCATNDDCGFGEVCGMDALCAAGACDDADNPCALGETCNAGTCEPPTEAVITQALGPVEVTPAGGPEIKVAVPEGAVSLAIVVQGAGDELIIADKIVTPTGDVVFDWTNDITTNRTNATDGLYTVLVPSNPEVELTRGEWGFVFLSGGSSFTGDATAIIKTSAATTKQLGLNLYFVGVDGLDAATAQTDQEFQRMIGNVEQVYAGAGVTIGDIQYRDVTGGDADRFRVIDSIENQDDELFELFTLSAPETTDAINLFVSDIVSADQGFSLLGIAGGVPGPPGIHGTRRSGVAINMAEWMEAASGMGPLSLADIRPKYELIVAHETAHYLGLYHTTERNGAALQDGINGSDPLSDTPVCPDDVDDGDGRLSAEECTAHDGGNLMFWSPLPTSRALSAQQGQILGGNPVVR